MQCMSTKHRKITLRLTEALYSQLKQLAESLGHSVTEEINLRLEESTSKDESIESIITQFDALFLSLKRAVKSTDQPSNNGKGAELSNLIAALDNDKKNMVLKFIRSIT